MKETNMEHYRSKIEAVIEKGWGFGLFDGEIESCHECRSCDFSDSNNAYDDKHTCSSRRIGWLMSEYKSSPVLTRREKHFVEFAETGYLTRSTNKVLVWWTASPRKDSGVWCGIPAKATGYLLTEHLDGMFNFITSEDEYPWSISKLRELKVEE